MDSLQEVVDEPLSEERKQAFIQKLGCSDEAMVEADCCMITPQKVEQKSEISSGSGSKKSTSASSTSAAGMLRKNISKPRGLLRRHSDHSGTYKAPPGDLLGEFDMEADRHNQNAQEVWADEGERLQGVGQQP